MIDENIQDALRMKYNPDGSSLRKAQLRMLEILQFVDGVCKRYDIKYWIEGGTLLGAVRHGGFIPWDDDVDISMPIDEYKRFRKIMLKYPNKYFVFQDHSTDDKFFNFWGVVRDIRSEYIQNSVAHQIRKYRGLQVDIFPMTDNVFPSLAKISYYHTAIRNRLLEKYGNSFSIRLVHFLFHLEQYVIIPLFKLVSIFKKERKRMFPCYGIPFIYGIEKEDIYPLSTVKFEKKLFSAPSVLSAYLKQEFGDYMKLPSENERNGHDVNIIFEE